MALLPRVRQEWFGGVIKHLGQRGIYLDSALRIGQCICHHSSKVIRHNPKIGIKGLDAELVNLEVKPIYNARNSVRDVHLRCDLLNVEQ
jgi:hypothetical protein